MSNLLTGISTLEAGSQLNQAQANSILTEIFEGKTPNEHIVKLLQLINVVGIKKETVVGFARAMKSHMTPVTLNKPAIDTCGTGGSGKTRFNTSTASAFVLAAMGVPVAKHGNHGSAKPNGSFDFLSSLRIDIQRSPEEQEQLFQNHNLCFLYARTHHPAVRFVGPARAEIKERTIFNLLGPLCNPGNIPFQVIGTTNMETGQLLAESIQELGTTQTIVVVNESGLDELTWDSSAQLFVVNSSTINKQTWSPKTVDKSQIHKSVINSLSMQNIPTNTESDTFNGSSFYGGTGEENANYFKEILKKPRITPIVETICLNAAVGLVCYKKAESIEKGYAEALTNILNGHVSKFVQEYVSAATAP